MKSIPRNDKTSILEAHDDMTDRNEASAETLRLLC